MNSAKCNFNVGIPYCRYYHTPILPPRDDDVAMHYVICENRYEQANSRPVEQELMCNSKQTEDNGWCWVIGVGVGQKIDRSID